MTTSTPNPPLMRLPRLIDLIGVQRSTIYGMVAAGSLPAPVNIGARAVAWVRSEIDTVIRALEGGASQEDIRALVAEIHAARSYRPDPARKAHYRAVAAKRKANALAAAVNAE